MLWRDAHPSDRELVLAADGELSPRRAGLLRRHLAACWECRLRAQELESAIGEFVRAHRRSLVLPPPAGRRALLEAQLQSLAARQSSRPWPSPLAWSRILVPVSAAVCLLALLLVFGPPRGGSRRELARYRQPSASVPPSTLTPGVSRAVSKDQLCRAEQSNNREVPLPVRRLVFERYGMSRADPNAYEVDYLISPALGGADDIGNLWPQPYSATIWNARVKDVLENRLHQLVCDGDLDLATAQRDISTDWVAAYKKYFRTDRPIDE